jgi:HD superfamily phosphohydrolase
VEEQVAALLHDISHTVLSHVIDHALSKPGEDSYHEVHKKRYLATTKLAEIVARHGISQDVFDEELFPLVERSAPRLCADRLDYALRDAVGFGKITTQAARAVLDSLKAFPSATATDRLLVLDDATVALNLSRAYMSIDNEIWSNPAHIDMYKRTGRVIGELVAAGSLNDSVLWQLSDVEFWEMLRQAANAEQLRDIQRLEDEGLPEVSDFRLPPHAKIRTIDPDVCEDGQERPQPLSVRLPEYGEERQEYINARLGHE